MKPWQNFVVLGGLVVAVVVLGYLYYQERQDRVELKIRVIQRTAPVTRVMAALRSSRKFSRASGTERPARRMRVRARLRRVASDRAPARTRQRSSRKVTSRM
jgi:hypothetical protein